MKLKLLDTLYTNELLLSILPFETGYLLRLDADDDAAIDQPCEYSVQLAMMLRSVEYTMHPHSQTLDTPPVN
jgi:hypothetical protein